MEVCLLKHARLLGFARSIVVLQCIEDANLNFINISIVLSLQSDYHLVCKTLHSRDISPI